MTTTKMNIGVSLSRNYNTIKLELLDEEIEIEDEIPSRSQIQGKINFLKDEINAAHDEIENEKKQ